MDKEREAQEARFLASNTLLQKIFDEAEKSAQNKIVSASRGDDHILRIAALELAVVRNIRSKITQLGKKEKDNG